MPSLWGTLYQTLWECKGELDKKLAFEELTVQQETAFQGKRLGPGAQTEHSCVGLSQSLPALQLWGGKRTCCVSPECGYLCAKAIPFPSPQVELCLPRAYRDTPITTSTPFLPYLSSLTE